MYKRGNGEVTLAASASTGQTRWEQGNSTAFRSAYPDSGHGPFATPLVLADRVVTAGVTGRIECRTRKDGSLLWARELWSGHGGTRLDYGYSSNPLAYRDTVIVPCGGRGGKSMLALRTHDGSVAWSRLDHPNVYSSPMLIEVGGLEQLVMDGHVIGLNPINQRRSTVEGALPGAIQYRRGNAGLDWPNPVRFG